MNNHEYLVDNEDKSLANNGIMEEHITDCSYQQDDPTKDCSYWECDTCGECCLAHKERWLKG
ncbi:hypothetical protein [Anaerosporobacter sp.]|uniref:hypothetical protein n=1 Tax=Anaerosporobacter sp. TaxID=1872529 RepID=UPI00286F2740|nr:hypothetical protein [Anaerosporobacter sp.]